MLTNISRRQAASRLLLSSLLALTAAPASVPAQTADSEGLIYRVHSANQRLEMIVNTSRLITLDEKIPKALVNNPEILQLVPMNANQVQVLARRAGVTTVNLWNERNEIRSIDVVVYGDARELETILQAQFPRASLKVTPLANSVIIKGYVERTDQVNLISRIASDYSPNIINNITVGGAQQVQLDIKVMEISRTKLRTMGFDFANFNGNDWVVSNVSGLISNVQPPQGPPPVNISADGTFNFNIVDGNNNFFGILEAMRRNNLVKVLASPKLVTVSGRPARFHSGGEFPIPQSGPLGSQTVEYKPFGTEVDFVPIVLGNGYIRLEVRPRVSEIDTTSLALTLREVDTGVEMRAGQTLAIAGLVQTRVSAETKGLPWVSELPVVGAAFRRVSETREEIETLILVTPQLVEAMDPHEVPPCGPGMRNDSPNDWELFGRGYIEVPKCCPTDGPEGMNYGPTYGPGYGGTAPQGGMMGVEELGPPPAPNQQAPAVPPAPPQLMQRNRPNRSAAAAPQQESRSAPPPASVRRTPPPTNSSRPAVAGPEDRNKRSNPPEPRPRTRAVQTSGTPGFVGPTGYDVLK